MKISPVALGTYNPSQVPRDVLLAEFTARQDMLADLLGVIRSNDIGHPCQHSLLIGPRGFGKTTSLFAIKYKIEDDAELSKAWTPLLFDEENYQIADLTGFWLECLRLAEMGLKGTDKNRYAELSISRDSHLEEKALSEFLSTLEISGKRALLLIDNLNDILTVVNNPEEQHRLRAFLMEESRVCIIGTACTYFDAIQDVDKPFYNLFRIFRLDRFTLKELKTALKAMWEARPKDGDQFPLPKEEGYWKGLHILTGGNPRLVKMIFQLMERGVTTDFRVQLEGLLDSYTPYFKHRIEAMSPQQRRVFDAIALAWDPVPLADITPGLRMESNQVSAQVGTLIDAQLIAVAGGSLKRRTYQVADRFSNIYYFMRYSRAGRSKFEWFVLTMKTVLTVDQYRKQLDRMREFGLACESEDDLHEQIQLLASATRAIDDVVERRKEGHKTVSSFLTGKQETALRHLLAEPSMKEALDDEHALIHFFTNLPKDQIRDVNYQPDSASWWYWLTDFAEEGKLWSLAEQAYRKAIALDSTYSYAWNGLGNLLADHLDRFNEAEQAYLKAIELDSSDAYPWNGLGNLLVEQLHRFSEAEEAYRKAIELDASFVNPWNGLGNLLKNNLKRIPEAEEAYRKAIEVDPKQAFPWNGLGNLLAEHLDRPLEAEAAFLKAIELDPLFARPWNGLGNLLKNSFGRYEEAEKAYLKAIEIDSVYASPWNGLGNLYKSCFKRFDEAEKAYRKAIEISPAYVSAWNGLGNLLRSQLRRYEESEKAYRKALDINPSAALIWNNFGFLLDDLKRFEESEKAYRKALELDPSRSLAKAGLARRLFDRGGDREEIIRLSKEAVLDSLENQWVRNIFQQVAMNAPEAVVEVLKTIASHLVELPTSNLNSKNEAILLSLHRFALDCIISLIKLGYTERVSACINEVKAREIFDIPIQAVELMKNPETKQKLAAERLALVEEFLKEVNESN